MAKALSDGWLDRELEACERMGVNLVTFRDPAFPPALLETRRPPMILYVKGALPDDGARTIAVVGTRGCSVYAERTAREIGSRAAARGWNLASGGAKGIDAAAHWGCAEAGGVNIAVLGSGVNVVYPSENRSLFEKIMERGALVSEFPLGSKSEAWHFPRRNRIIAGLSSKVVVVEAPRKSGAVITAGLALEEGREVWAVPGRIDDVRCAGSNMLIFDGATPLADYELFFGSRSQYAEKTLFDDDALAAPNGVDRSNLSEKEKKILSILSLRGGCTIDNLADEAKMSAAEVFQAVTVMSLRGLVFSSGAGRYSSYD
jgi:DNA processing protein